MDWTVILVVGVVFAVVFGVLGQYIADQKNRDGGEGFLLGFLSGPLGVRLEALLPIDHDRETREQEEESAIAEREAAIAARDKAQREWVAEQVKQPLLWIAAVREWHTARRMERDKAYRAIGIEPGPWAWYRALSDVQQAVVLGLAFGLPAGVILVIIVLVPKVLGGR
jgi:hypothetical protein